MGLDRSWKRANAINTEKDTFWVLRTPGPVGCILRQGRAALGSSSSLRADVGPSLEGFFIGSSLWLKARLAMRLLCMLFGGGGGQSFVGCPGRQQAQRRGAPSFLGTPFPFLFLLFL